MNTKENWLHYFRDDSLFPNINEIVWNEQQAVSAMSEYAKEVAIDFGNFLHNNYDAWDDMWVKKNNLPEGLFTTKDLFDIYLKSKQNATP